MTLRIIIGMLLMAVSNLLAWHLVWMAHKKTSLSKLQSAVSKVSLFYALWAGYNIVILGRDDLGAVSFGILFLTTVLPTNSGSGGGMIHSIAMFLSKLRVAACVVVVMNYSIVLPMIYKAGGPIRFGKMLWRQESVPLLVSVWSVVFTSYIVSSMVLWTFSGYLFCKLAPSDDEGDGQDYTTPIIQQSDYQPIETNDV